LYQVRAPDAERRGIYLGSIDGSMNKRVFDSSWGAKYAPGHVLFLRGSTLMAQPFDVDRGALTGAPVSIAQQVSGSSAGYGAFSVSATGVLAYAKDVAAPTQLAWVDRAGLTVDSIAPPGDYLDMQLSPDGSRLAYRRQAQAGRPTSGCSIWRATRRRD
jgi:hypothetical protein